MTYNSALGHSIPMETTRANFQYNVLCSASVMVVVGGEREDEVQADLRKD